MKDLKFEKPATSVIELSEDGNTGKFEITPLERGFGLTLGNALRRVLLSSLPGTAFVNVKIDGAQHEFMSLDGVMEDVITIILNLKGVILKTDSEDPDFTVQVEIHKGAGEVTAADIIHGNELTIVNPDHHIATVSEGGSLNMVLTVRRGVGFVPANKNKEYNETVGEIAIDSIYTPIVNVNFSVEKTRVENEANHDDLVIEVTTNGSISAKEALAMASKMLIEHLNVVVELSEKASNTDFMMEPNDDSQNKKLEMTIDDLDLSVRSYNCLKRAALNTVADLTAKSEEDMMKVRNLGRKSLKEIKEKLEDMGLGFRKD
ncbi:MAG: DNA-directed RNA polymerase subunit alpha [Acholeplasmatales bacterium]|jgi:DNA-directed RNA polymerase subunit alpha|nr:DNA-directed RNA polymerase subunit alpha [Acholeplasmatales bacterium]